MLKVIIDLVIALVMPISGFFVIKNLTGSDEKIYSLKNILILVLLALWNLLVYSIEYEYVTTILNFCALIIGYKYIFNLNVFSSFLLCIVLMLFVFASEVLLYAVALSYFSEEIRDFGVIMLFANILIGVMTVLISKIKYINTIIKKILLKLEETKIKTVFTAILWFVVTSLLCYTIFKSPTNNIGFWLSLFIEIVFLVFMINYFRDKDRYISLNEKFDDLYNYIQTMEEYIDSEKLNIHEYKNQLSVIKSMTNNKKIKEYIDSLVVETKIEGEWSSELKNLPKGGLKGLLYYKLAQASSKGINVLVTVSKDCNTVFKKFSLEETKQLSRLVGIYMDNAIEATANTKKKNLTLEIYKIKGNVNIVISNSIEEDIDLKQVTKKGFSSKGKGRGNGLYLAKKMLAKNAKIEAESKILNGFYVQRIIIK